MSNYTAGHYRASYECAASKMDRLEDRIREAYAHIATAEAQLVAEDDEGIAGHIRAAARILLGES